MVVFIYRKKMKIKKKQRKARFSYEVGKQKTISNPTAHATASRQRQ